MIRPIMSAALLAASAATASTCAAQSAYDRFLAGEEASREENAQMSESLERFAAILNGADPARAMRAMEFMLASGEPELVRYAAEFGLFSADQRLQNAALRTIFDTRAQYRMVVDISDPDQDATEFLNFYDGTPNADASEGYITFTIGDHDEDAACWPFSTSGLCAIILTGASVSLRDWRFLTGDLSLNADGILEGTVTYNKGHTYPARIELID